MREKISLTASNGISVDVDSPMSDYSIFVYDFIAFYGCKTRTRFSTECLHQQLQQPNKTKKKTETNMNSWMNLLRCEWISFNNITTRKSIKWVLEAEMDVWQEIDSVSEDTFNLHSQIAEIFK